MKEADQKWIEKQCIIIEKEITAGSSTKAYSNLKTLTKTETIVISDADRILFIECRSLKPVE
ncbi:hypothetical protein DPMN_182518 [Dreissena polymorpha]|uniref:Uncharacterized protein n=1 Tax=Dreissena polymorpha TaxID=45954 RepID=A0A9D4DFS6_DREPO|nr:hypothetical protein DPMN_182518 [Dreissena polymorpha]